MAELSLLSLKKSLAHNMTTEPVSLEIGSMGPNRIWFLKKEKEKKDQINEDRTHARQTAWFSFCYSFVFRYIFLLIVTKGQN